MIQLAELLFDEEPALDFDAILADMRRELGPSLEAQVSGDGRGRLIVHQLGDDEGESPARTAILPSPEAPSAVRFTEELQQSWRCPDAAERVDRARYSVLVTEVAGRGLSDEMRSPTRRAMRFHATLEAALRNSEASTVAVRSSQQIVGREDYLSEIGLPPMQRPGGLNVRVYRTDENSMLMDTFGMEAMGLHDLQCRFRDLPPEDVARVLFNTAWYLFENGPSIEDGHTISGRDQEEQWSCRFESSVAAPTRQLLDLNPGPPYALGARLDNPDPEPSTGASD